MKVTGENVTFENVTEPSREAFRWIASLPQSVRPMQLAKSYPRIVNEIASCWNFPGKCRRYLNELIIDLKRDDRAGFPPEVGWEILKLNDYHGRLLARLPADDYQPGRLFYQGVRTPVFAKYDDLVD